MDGHHATTATLLGSLVAVVVQQLRHAVTRVQELREAVRTAAVSSSGGALCNAVRAELGDTRQLSQVMYMLLGSATNTQVIDAVSE